MNKTLLSLAILGVAAFADGFAAPPYAPPPISARFNIRYSWGLGPKALKAIGKDRMNTTDRLDLPASVPVLKGNAAEQTIQGTVDLLPLTYYLRLTRSAPSDPGVLEVNVIDNATHKVMKGFPKKIERALAALAGDDGVLIDLNLTDAENATLVESLRASLKKDGVEVHGPVIADPPFLTIRAAPK